MTKLKISQEELEAAFDKVRAENPDITDWKACEIVSRGMNVSANTVYLRVCKRRIKAQPLIKEHPQNGINEPPQPKLQSQISDPPELQKKPRCIRPEIYVGNKTGFKYKATGKGLLIQQVMNEKVGSIQVLSIEEFIQELQDCKSLF